LGRIFAAPLDGMVMMKLVRCMALAAMLLAPCRALAVTPQGPAHGTLIIVGGGTLGQDILGRFIALAGGPDAPIVMIPTAQGEKAYPSNWKGLEVLKKAGARNVLLLHTDDRHEADSEAFTAPLRKARGVWFYGGRQWHLVDSYLGTRTQKEIEAVLARGGVVGGTSAGASIQGSYLVRGARSGNTIMMAPGYEQGFGLLQHAAVDQHVNTRGRVHDIAAVIAAHPDLLGIGLDENTAIQVGSKGFDVLGAGQAHITTADPAGAPAIRAELHAGQHFDFQPLPAKGE
jgi:cyanophycinase